MPAKDVSCIIQDLNLETNALKHVVVVKKVHEADSVVSTPLLGIRRLRRHRWMALQQSLLDCKFAKLLRQPPQIDLQKAVNVTHHKLDDNFIQENRYTINHNCAKIERY